MEIELKNGIAVVKDGEPVIVDVQSALDLIATVRYEYGASCIAIAKSAVVDRFFQLSTGVCGEILQKFSNYGARLAIIGDFSGYTSKPLQDFIRECNRGNAVFFVATEEEAVKNCRRW